MTRNIGRTGEDHVIEGEGRERLPDFWTARESGDLGGVEGLGDDLLDHLRGFRSELRGLDHGAVTRRENASERLEHHCHREVPGCDDADYPFGLVLNMRAPTEKPQWERRGTLLVLHPLLEVLAAVLHRAD